MRLQWVAILLNALLLAHGDILMEDGLDFGMDRDNPQAFVNDTRKLLSLTKQPPTLSFSYGMHFQVVDKDENEMETVNVLTANRHFVLNGTRLLTILGVEDPTLEELAALFGEVSLNALAERADSKYLDVKMKDSHLHSYSFQGGRHFHNEVESHTGYFEYPTERHSYTLRKYASSVFPTYIAIGVLSLLSYIFRAKLFDHQERVIKLSNVSSMIVRVLILRLVFDSFYLVYLALFAALHLFSHKSFYFLFVVLDQLIELFIFHLTISVFVQGFLTLHFDKKVIWNKFAITVTSLYIVSVFATRVYVKTVAIENFYYIDGMYHFDINGTEINFVVFACVFTIVCRIGLFVLIGKQFWTSYNDSNRDEKFLRSFIVIGVAYFLSPYIRVPVFYGVSDIWAENLKLLFIGDGDINLSESTTPVPELIQIFTGVLLIYIWRDTSYKSLQQDDIELQ